MEYHPRIVERELIKGRREKGEGRSAMQCDFYIELSGEIP